MAMRAAAKMKTMFREGSGRPLFNNGLHTEASVKNISLIQEQPKNDSQLQRVWKGNSRYKHTSECLQKICGIGGLFDFEKGYTRSFPNQMFARRSFSTLPSTTEALIVCIGSVLLFKGSKYVKAKLCKRPQPSIYIANGLGSNVISCKFDLKGLDIEKISCEILDERKLIVYCPDRSTNVKIPVYTVDLPTGSYVNAIITAQADMKQRLLTVQILDYKYPSLKLQVLLS